MVVVGDCSKSGGFRVKKLSPRSQCHGPGNDYDGGTGCYPAIGHHQSPEKIQVVRKVFPDIQSILSRGRQCALSTITELKP